jgi:hypothetical protein
MWMPTYGVGKAAGMWMPAYGAIKEAGLRGWQERMQ